MYGLQPLIIRASNPYGPRQGHLIAQGVIATFMSRIINGEKIQIWGNGTHKRDYLYVTDLAKLCRLTIEKEHCGVINAGCGHAMSLSEVLQGIEAELQCRAEVQYTESRKYDVHEIALDITKAKQIFDWQPTVSFKQGLSIQHAWMKNALKTSL